VSVPESRLDNLDGGRHCPYCCGSPGWVFVGWSAVGTDQMAPCPHCALGWQVEFGKAGARLWADGYWQGRPTGGIAVVCVCGKRTPPKEARIRIRELTASLGLLIRTPEEALRDDVPEFIPE
jgi:hypothetical protein